MHLEDVWAVEVSRAPGSCTHWAPISAEYSSNVIAGQDDQENVIAGHDDQENVIACHDEQENVIGGNNQFKRYLGQRMPNQ